MISKMEEVSYCAPQSLANVGPGFDIFSIAYEPHLRGDIVRAKKTDKFKGAKLIEIINNPALELRPSNVVEAVGNKLLSLAGQQEKIGIELILEKNMRIGTGMGSSASSSVAAALSVNDLLENPFPRDSPEMKQAVVHGEYVATKGSPHADNVLASLLGGFIFIHDLSNYQHIRFQGGNNIYLVVASPINLRVDTSQARAALTIDKEELAHTSAKYIMDYLGSDDKLSPKSYASKFASYVKCEETLLYEYLKGGAFVIDGMKLDFPRMLGFGVSRDAIVTPVRAQFITGYDAAKDGAMNAGAFGFSISGSGPAVFAVSGEENNAHKVGDAIQRGFEKYEVKAEIYVSKINNLGAQRI